MSSATRAALLGMALLFMLGTAQMVQARHLLDDEDDSENCGRIRVENACRQNRGCAWCKSKPKNGCVSAKAARYIVNAKSATCQGAAIPAKTASKCDRPTAERACLDVDDDSECAWCVTKAATGTVKAVTKCLPKQSAEYLPNFAKICKYDRDDDNNNNSNNNNNNNNNDDDNDDDNDDGDDRD